MITTLLVTLALSAPLAAMAWLGALALDSTGAGLKTRRAVWTLSFTVPVALAPMALAVRALGWSAQPAPLAFAEGLGSTSMPVLTSLPSTGRETPISAEGLDWTTVLMALFVLGVTIRLSILAWRGLALRHLVISSQPLAGDFGGMIVRLYDGETPVLAGCLKPVVLMPRNLAATLTHAQIAMICVHERAHMRSGDHIANLLEAVAMAIFWFNPVLGPIRAGLGAVREEICDAAALTGAERSIRRDYAEVLLAAIRYAGGAQPSVAFTGLYRARSTRRIRAILTPHERGAKATVALAAGLSLMLAGAAGCLSFAFAGNEVPKARGALKQIPAQAPLAVATTETTIVERPVMVPTKTSTTAAVALPDLNPSLRPMGEAINEVAYRSDRDTGAALNVLLTETRINRIEAAAQLKALDSLDVLNWPEVRRHPDIRQLNTQIQELASQRSKLATSFAAIHPELVRIVSQIDGLQAERQKQAELIRGDLETELRMMEAKEVAIREQLSELTVKLDR